MNLGLRKGLRLHIGRGRLRAFGARGWYAYWGVTHGLPLPHWLSALLVRAWNHIACRVWGHDDVLWHLSRVEGYEHIPVECTNCCQPLKRCTCGSK